MKRAHVCIDDTLGPFPALVAYERWNGWAVPYFDESTARDVVRAINANFDPLSGHDGETRAEWRGDVVRIFTYYGGQVEDAPEEIPPTWIDGEKFWGIGAYSWVWSEAD